MNEVTEYDGYVIKLPYINKNLTDEEKKELEIKRQEAKQKTLDSVAALSK